MFDSCGTALCSIQFSVYCVVASNLSAGTSAGNIYLLRAWLGFQTDEFQPHNRQVFLNTNNNNYLTL